jgi:hypothetical protein
LLKELTRHFCRARWLALTLTSGGLLFVVDAARTSIEETADDDMSRRYPGSSLSSVSSRSRCRRKVRRAGEMESLRFR